MFETTIEPGESQTSSQTLMPSDITTPTPTKQRSPIVTFPAVVTRVEKKVCFFTRPP